MIHKKSQWFTKFDWVLVAVLILLIVYIIFKVGIT